MGAGMSTSISLADAWPLVGTLALLAVAGRLGGVVAHFMSAKHDARAASDAVLACPVVKGHFFKSARTGMCVYTHTWQVPTPKARVIIVHGTGEHLGRYEHVVAGLTASGFRVHAMDHQGHGRSDGTRCYFERLDDLVSDVVQYTQAVTSEQPQLPTFVLAHSLGSLVTLLAAQNKEFASRLAGVVLSAPALAFDPKLDTPFNRFLVLTLSGWLPKMPVEHIDPSKVCSEPGVVEYYKRDPLVYHGGVRVRVGYEMLAGARRALAGASAITLPLLVEHGEADVLCPSRGSTDLFTRLSSCPDKTLKMWPGLSHEVLNEAEYDKVLRHAMEWMTARL